MHLNRLTLIMQKKKTARDLHQIKKFWTAVQHCADGKGIEQHYSYEDMILKLLKIKTDIDRYTFYINYI